ncbi:MAG TPA: hypothetical protein VIW24_10705 [Aldersonia sp.]
MIAPARLAFSVGRGGYPDRDRAGVTRTGGIMTIRYPNDPNRYGYGDDPRLVRTYHGDK